MSSGRISQTAVDAGPEQPLPSSLARGHSIARYMLLERVGAGGMGVVWAAYDPELDRRIALKLLRPRAAGGAEAQARLLREAQAMAKLSHPHVIAIHDVGQHAGQVFLAMEFVEGDTLGRWQACTPARGWAEVVAVYVQAGRGLAAAHAAGLVHRDFKPDNVLIGSDGRVRVTDFGLARSVEAEVGEHARVVDMRTLASSSASITQTGALVGTPAYMAPEQFVGGPLDARSDQFAFCVALWEALHRQRPFAGRTVAQLGEAVASGVIVAPPSDPHVPSFVERALRRGLASEPDARWPDMDALLSALSHDLEGQRRRRVRLGVGLGLLATMALSVPLLIDRDDEAHAGPSCADAPTRLAGVWDAEVAAELEPIVVAARDGRMLWPQLVADLDAYAAEWQAMYVDACEATHVRGDQSQELLDRRMQCLDERRTSLAMVVGLISAGEARAVSGSLMLLTTLPTVASCGDRDYLDSPLPIPADPEAAARVREIRREVAELRARIEISDYEVPLAALDRLLAEADALGFAPLHAELRTERAIGESLRSSGDAPGLRELLEQALVEALRVGRDDLAARVATELIYVVGTAAHDVEGGLYWADLVDAWHARGGADVYTRAMALITRGHVLAYADRMREAELAFEQALGLLGVEPSLQGLGRLTSRERLALAYVLQGLSRVALGDADYVRARALLDEARAIMRGYFPREHEMVGFVEGNLAIVLIVLGEWKHAIELLEEIAGNEALAHATSSRQGWLRASVLLAELHIMLAELRGEGAGRTTTLDLAAHLLDRVGDEEQLDALTRARRRVCRVRLARLAGRLDEAELGLVALAGEIGPQSTALAMLELEHVRIELARAQPAAALARIEGLAAVLASPLLVGHPIHAAALGYRSHALHALGRSGEAKQANDEALALLEGLRPAGHPLAIRWLEQAAELEPARAVELRARAQALRDALP